MSIARYRRKQLAKRDGTLAPSSERAPEAGAERPAAADPVPKPARDPKPR